MRPLFVLGVLLSAIVAAGCTDLNAGTTEPSPNAAAALPSAGYTPALALAQSIDLAVAASEPVTISAMMENDLRGSGTLGAPRDFSVFLRPGLLLNESTWAEVDGERVPLPDVKVYEGEVEGREDSVVRLTVTPDWVRGNIRFGDVQYLVRLGLDGNLPHVSTNGEAPAAPANATEANAAARAYPWEEAPLTFYDKNGMEEEDCLRPAPSDFTPMVEPLPGPTMKEHLAARLVMDGDYEYVNQTGRHAFPLLVAFANEVDGIYQHEVGIRFVLTGLHLNTDPKFYPDPADEAPQGKMMEYWNARTDVARDVVHLVTGIPSSYAMANCIGGAGMPELAYTFTPLNWARNYVVFHEQALAHELGHIFSAHHHYGNHAEATWSGTRSGAAAVPQAGLATIMIQGYTPGAKPVFGTIEKSVIRGWAENHLGKHDAASE